MNRDLAIGATVAVTVHALLCVPGLRAQGAAVDVARGLTSFEVELIAAAEVAPATMELPTRSEEPPAEQTVDDAWSTEERPVVVTSQPQPSESAIGQGAFIEAASHGIPNRPPMYPWVARLRGWEGVVVLQVMVRASGRVERVGVVQSSGYALLDRAAQGAVEQWMFTPATRFGRSVPSEVELPVRFRLSSSRGGAS